MFASMSGSLMEKIEMDASLSQQTSSQVWIGSLILLFKLLTMNIY